jgi:hypothetical protein
MPTPFFLVSFSGAHGKKRESCKIDLRDEPAILRRPRMNMKILCHVMDCMITPYSYFHLSLLIVCLVS